MAEIHHAVEWVVTRVSQGEILLAEEARFFDLEHFVAEGRDVMSGFQGLATIGFQLFFSRSVSQYASRPGQLLHKGLVGQAVQGPCEAVESCGVGVGKCTCH